jgi:hypothetical protein
MVPNPQQGYFRKRYVADIVQNGPAVFVDAVGPGEVLLTDRKSNGFETFPELAAVIHSQYELVCDVGGFRIFQSRVAAAEHPGSIPNGCPGRLDLHRLSTAELSRLRPVDKPPAIAVIDGLGTSGVPGISTTRNFAAGTRIAAYGWALDPLSTKPGAGLILIVDGKLRTDATAAYGQDRPDVATALKAPDAEFSGFGNAVVLSAGLSKGQHALQVGVLAGDRKSFYTIAKATTFTIH